MRLVLSISEKAARALRVLAAEQGLRGVSALVELVYGGDPPVMVHRSSDLAQLLEKIAAQEPGTMTGNDIDWTKFDTDPGVQKARTPNEDEKIWDNIRAYGLITVPAATEVAPEILPEIVAEEGTLGDGHE